VVCLHVLEHVSNDSFLVNELKRVARKRAVAVVPVGERDDPDHERTYMPKDLEKFDADIVEQSQMDGLIDAVMLWKLSRRLH